MISNGLSIISQLEKKLLIQNLYSKFIVRSVQKKDYKKKLLWVDDNCNIFVLQLNSRFMKRFFKDLNAGISFFFNTFNYKKNTRKNFQFEFQQILLKSPVTFINYVNFLLIKLQSLRSNKKFLILIRPCRGGIRCLFNGLKGIFPRKHVKISMYALPLASLNPNLKGQLPILMFYLARRTLPGLFFLRFLLVIKYSFSLKKFIRLQIQNLKKKSMINGKRRLKLKKLRKLSRKAIGFYCFRS